MQKKKSIALAAAAVVALTSSPSWGAIQKKRTTLAEDYPQDILTNAIGVYVTPRGQKALAADAIPILSVNGLSTDKGGIPTWQYNATSAIDVGDLPVNLQGQHATTIKTLADSLTKDFSEFPAFNNPLISVNFKGASYEAKITRLALVPDLNKTKSRGNTNEVIFEAQIEVESLTVGLTSVGVIDHNNRFFSHGDIGINGISVKSDPSVPLIITVPLAVSIDSNNRLGIKALEAQCNVADMKLDWNYDKLVIPAFHLLLEDDNDPNKTSDALVAKPKWTTLDPEVKSQLPAISLAAQTYIGNYIKDNAVSLINNAFVNVVDVNTMLQEVNTMEPAGAPVVAVNPAPYTWGLVMNTLGLNDQFLSSNINVFIVDQSPGAVDQPLPAGAMAKSAPDLTKVDPSTYDVALQLDEGFINRLLQLSFLRGYFNSIPEPGKLPLKLMTAPTIMADGTTAPDQLIMHASIQYTDNTPGLIGELEHKFVIHNPLVINVDMAILLKTDLTSGTINLQEGPINLDTVKLGAGAVRNSMFTGKVMDAVRAALTEYNQTAEKTPAFLTTTPIALPNGLAGLPLVLNSVQADSSGNLMAYLRYGDTTK